jgi:hypothetical protein
VRSELRWRNGCKLKKLLRVGDNEALPVLPDDVGTPYTLQLLVDALPGASQQLRQFFLLELDVRTHLAAACVSGSVLVHQLGQMAVPSID